MVAFCHLGYPKALWYVKQELILKQSEIEGERLDPNAVRSSVAQQLGLPTAGMASINNQQADGVVYEAPPAERLANEMKRFFCWWEERREEMGGILRAGMAHLWFVAVHPFEDGNGRVARALTEMALAHDENLSTRYYSLSSQIMFERENSYRNSITVVLLRHRYLTCEGKYFLT